MTDTNNEIYPKSRTFKIDDICYDSWLYQNRVAIASGNVPSFNKRLSRFCDICTRIDVQGHELGTHTLMAHKLELCTLSQSEDMDNFPLASLMFTDMYIHFKPNEKSLITMPWGEFYSIILDQTIEQVQRSTTSGYRDIVDGWQELQQSFIHELHGWCTNAPFVRDNHWNLTRETPPIFTSKLLIPGDDDNMDEWIRDNTEKLLEEMYFSELKHENRNSPGEPGTVLEYATGLFGDIQTIQDECDDHRYANSRMSCLVLHTKTVPVITPEHIQARKDFNSNTFTFEEVLKRWHPLYDEVLETLTQKHIGVSEEGDDVRVPSRELVTRVSYTVHGEYIHNNDERKKFITTTREWRNFSVGCGCIIKI